MKSFLTQLFTIFVLLGNTQLSLAQAPDALWTKTFGGSDNDFGNNVQQTSDGGFVIVGQLGTVSGAIDSGSVVLFRTNSGGDSLWSKIYNTPGRDAGNAVQQTSDGGYIIAGYTTSVGGSDRDAWLIRTDVNGDTTWTRTFGGSSTDQANGVLQTPDGGFIAVGATRSFGAGGTDIWLIRTNANGDTLWTKTYGVAGSEVGNSIEKTSDDGFVITGSFFSFDTGSTDLWLLRTDADGDTLWTKTYNGPYYSYSLDSGSAVRQTSDGGFIIIGETSGLPDTRNTDMWLVRTDANGDTLWNKNFGRASTDRGYDVVQTSDGGFVLAGFSFDGINNIDALLIGTDTDGDSLWSIIIGEETGNDQLHSVQKTSDGGLIVTGFTSSYGDGSNDVWLIRLGSDTPTSVEDTGLFTPAEFRLHQNYPNPFNPKTTISYTIKKAENVGLTVYNTLGKTVRSLVKGYQPAGRHSVAWDGRNDAGRLLGSGLYYYELTVGDVVQTRRMLFMK